MTRAGCRGAGSNRQWWVPMVAVVGALTVLAVLLVAAGLLGIPVWYR